jgi:hypothetical protein
MRARTVVIIFCLVLSLVPCFATSSKQQTKRKLSYTQVAAYGLVAAVVNTAVSTVIASYYAELVRKTNPNSQHTHSARDVLEFVDAKINQELASRGLGQVPLDELD